MRTLATAFVAFVSLLGAGCSDDPVSQSSPVGINLKAASGDVKTGVISRDKGITTESGNPWSKFVSDAQARLGRDPSDIKLRSLTLLLATSSKGVTALEEVFTGEVAVQFILDTSNNVVPVGRVTGPMGRGPVDMQIDFSYAQVPAQDIAKFLGGSFKVVLSGPAAADFMGKGAEADLQLTFIFEAFAQPQN